MRVELQIQRFRQPKVQELGGPVCPHFDVGRFQIAMNHTLVVRGCEGLSDLKRDIQRIFDRDSALF